MGPYRPLLKYTNKVLLVYMCFFLSKLRVRSEEENELVNGISTRCLLFTVHVNLLLFDKEMVFEL